MLATETKPQLLLVEDDINLGYLLTENLHAKGYSVRHALTGDEGIKAINATAFDLCLLDIMLPEQDGFSIAAYLRKARPDVPFIFLTSRAQETDRLHGFEMGADDYVLKPFSFRELHYRLQVVLRHCKKSSPILEEQTELHIGQVILRCHDRMLVVRGHERKLSQRETELLQVLMQHQGNYVSRSEILKRLWGRDDYFTAKSMDVYLTRIRKLIKDEPGLEIENLYGSGYRIKAVRVS
jgi:DNA-binding response OmpR family regulator